jgi:hypothetical protein
MQEGMHPGWFLDSSGCLQRVKARPELLVWCCNNSKVRIVQSSCFVLTSGATKYQIRILLHFRHVGDASEADTMWRDSLSQPDVSIVLNLYLVMVERVDSQDMGLPGVECSGGYVMLEQQKSA